MNDCHGQLDEAVTKQEIAEEELRQQSNEASKLQSMLDHADDGERIASLEHILITAQQQHAELQSELQRVSIERDKLNDELADIQSMWDDAGASKRKVTLLEQRLASFDEQRADVAELRSSTLHLSRQLDAMRQLSNKTQQQLDSALTEQEATNHELTLTHAELEQLRQRGEDDAAEVARLTNKLRLAEATTEQQASALKNFRGVEKSEASVAALKQQVASTELHLDRSEMERATLSKKLKNAEAVVETQSAALKNSQSEVQMHLEHAERSECECAQVKLKLKSVETMLETLRNAQRNTILTKGSEKEEDTGALQLKVRSLEAKLTYMSC